MKEAACMYCHGTGWVKETDLSQPWDEVKDTCAGANCSCNPNGNCDFDVVFAEVEQ